MRLMDSVFLKENGDYHLQREYKIMRCKHGKSKKDIYVYIQKHGYWWY